MGSIKKLLPKTYLQRKHVAQEIYAALIHYKNLTPMMDYYLFNDGRTSFLMSISGTIPALYKDNSYNIPVCLWLDESYPQSAPLCYVKPTREMMMVKGKHLDSCGQVILPYLEEWNQDTCDLVSLLQVMSAAFGEFPPVCVRPHPEAEQASCSRHVYRRADGLVEGPRLFLTTEDDQPFKQDNETSC